jgi:GntR family transcriptional regulator
VVPIWKQIEDGVSSLIAAGALRPGETIASVRELARLLQVNPLTVQKAYRRLIDLGVLEVRRGEGTIVSANPPAPASAERARKLREAAERFIEQARNLRAPKEECLSLLNDAWPDGEEPANVEER